MLKQKPVLRGDKNQCSGCGELFRSTYAFTLHRVGEFGVNRRCLTPDQMSERGMVKRADGFWVGSVMSDDVLAKRASAKPEHPIIS